MNYSVDWDGPGEVDADEHPLDTCECGDYRGDHVDGHGRCKFSVGAWGDGHSGAGRCDQFRLSQRYKAGDYVPAGFKPIIQGK